ncbi:MAG: sugar kinase [Planctomycetes bacterium]|nr:sugar kinase [Planctomycetota bacterium]
MSLLVTGSIGIDTVQTPHGSVEGVLGGSAVYFSFAAAPFTPVRLVATVGEDFPDEFRQVLAQRGIDLAGLETRVGSKTFRWSGRYEGDMNAAETVDVSLNVLAEAAPNVPEAFADSRVVFLANTHPALQRELLAQVRTPQLTVCDTMNLWIENEREALLATLAAVDGIIINDGEARQLTGEVNLIDAARAIRGFGPRFVVVKKGEHGALLATEDEITVIPARPTADVRDPTGAGDSFAGGMLGYLAAEGHYDGQTLRRALLRGTVTASFAIERFSLDGLRDRTKADIDERVAGLSRMLSID